MLLQLLLYSVNQCITRANKIKKTFLKLGFVKIPGFEAGEKLDSGNGFLFYLGYLFNILNEFISYFL